MAGAIIDSTGQSWLTPPEIIDKVVDVFQEIDLDPCGSARGWVSAKQTYTGPRAWGGDGRDGLSEPWTGRIFVNPPYGRTAPHPEICGGRATSMADWLRKCEESSQKGCDVIALVPAAVETNFWFNSVWDKAVVCFLRHRVVFWTRNDNKVPVPAKSCIPKPIAVLYYGNAYEWAFRSIFGQVGFVP